MLTKLSELSSLPNLRLLFINDNCLSRSRDIVKLSVADTKAHQLTHCRYCENCRCLLSLGTSCATALTVAILCCSTFHIFW